MPHEKSETFSFSPLSFGAVHRPGIFSVPPFFSPPTKPRDDPEIPSFPHNWIFSLLFLFLVPLHGGKIFTVMAQRSFDG